MKSAESSYSEALVITLLLIFSLSRYLFFLKKRELVVQKNTELFSKAKSSKKRSSYKKVKLNLRREKHKIVIFKDIYVSVCILYHNK